MKKLVLTAFAIASLSTAAVAADLDPVPEPTVGIWEGWYAGINGGYGFVDEYDVGIHTSDYEPTDSLLGTSYWPSTLDPDASGFFGGGQVGYNWQKDEWVYGLEGDFQFSDIDGRDSAYDSDSFFLSLSGTTFEVNESASAQVRQDLKWFSTFRGRFGVAPYEELLFYATGGLAIGRLKNALTLDHMSDIEITSRINDGTFLAGAFLDEGLAASRSKTKVGWTAGFGSELKITEDVSVKFEYLYLDLGKTTVSGDILRTTTLVSEFNGEPAPDTPVTIEDTNGKASAKFKNRFHTVKVGVNWGF